MTATLLFGEPIAAALREEAKLLAIAAAAARGRGPFLQIIGSADPSAEVYAARICKDAKNCAIDARVELLPIDAGQEAAEFVVNRFARDRDVDAILLQTPLPKAVDSAKLADLIPLQKDVDGVSLMNAGACAVGRSDAYYPATAASVLEIIKKSNVRVAGARAIVLGRSAVVGRPAALGLLAMDATVTIAHSKTKDIEKLIKEADIVVAAVGKLAMVRPEWIKPGALVIDVGIHRITDEGIAKKLFSNHPERMAAFQQKGSIVAGDCHPDIVTIAGMLTPVPGGVGPVTSAILLKQTSTAASRAGNR